MSLFYADDHAANPPDTWEVVRVQRPWMKRPIWHLTPAGRPNDVMQSCETRKEAERLKVEGFYVNLYEKERRWYAGEPVAGWKPFTEDVREAQRRAAARRSA